MSGDTPGDDPREIAAARHEGLVDDVAWQALVARHGVDLERAAAEHAAIAEALAALPRTPARPGSAAAIIAALPHGTSIHARRRSLWWAPLLAAAACLMAAWFLFTIDGRSERPDATDMAASAPTVPASSPVRATTPALPGKSGMPPASAPGDATVAWNDQSNAASARRRLLDRRQGPGGPAPDARIAGEERSLQLEPDAQDVRELRERGFDRSFGDASDRTAAGGAAPGAIHAKAALAMGGAREQSPARQAEDGGPVVALKDADDEAPRGSGTAAPGGPSDALVRAPLEHGAPAPTPAAAPAPAPAAAAIADATAERPAPGAALVIGPAASDQAARADQPRSNQMGAPGAASPAAAPAGAAPPLQRLEGAQGSDDASGHERLAQVQAAGGADGADGADVADAQRLAVAPATPGGLPANGGGRAAPQAPVSLLCVSEDAQAIVLELEWRAPPGVDLHRGALLLQGLDRMGRGIWTMATHLPPSDIQGGNAPDGRPALHAWRVALGPAQAPPATVIALRLLAPGCRSDPVSVARPGAAQSAALPTQAGAAPAPGQPTMPAQPAPGSASPAAAPSPPP